ncbi:MAG: FkbM family methyltransferase, partial [Anaerolineae bacterium]
HGRIAHHNPERAIFCFEPLPGNAAMARRNCPGAVVTETAVGAARGEMTLDVDADGVMASQDMRYAWQTKPATFPVAPLDELAAELGIGDIALIKMDAEGGELDIFAGGKAAFARAGQVAMETHGRDKHDASLESLIAAGLAIDEENFDGRTGMIFASRPI